MAYALVIAFGGTVLLICLLKCFAHNLALVDRPNERKCHLGDIPIVGGLAMFLSLWLTNTFFLNSAPHGFLACAFFLVLCGAWDDRFALSARTRFIVQAAVAFAMAYLNGMLIYGLGKLFTDHALVLPPIVAYPFTVFCVLGVINAINMLDGIDGLAGGVALTALLWFAVISFLAAQSVSATFLLLLGATTLGFLVFNMRYWRHHRATVFMGDAGSMMLGFALAWFAIHLTHYRTGGAPVVPPITAVWIVGLPILDTVVVMSKRMLRGHSPFQPGRDHLHHLLLQRKLNDATVAWLMIVISAALGLVGVLGWLFAIPDYFLSYGFVLLGGIYGGVHWSLGLAVRQMAAGTTVVEPLHTARPAQFPTYMGRPAARQRDHLQARQRVQAGKAGQK